MLQHYKQRWIGWKFQEYKPSFDYTSVQYPPKKALSSLEGDYLFCTGSNGISCVYVCVCVYVSISDAIILLLGRLLLLLHQIVLLCTIVQVV